MRRRAAPAGALLGLAASIAFGLAGCATPVLKPEVEMPARFVQAASTDVEPEIAWWESYADPVLTDLIRRAAHENRDVKIAAARVRAARAGATISRSWLFPSISAVGTALHADTGYDAVRRQALPDADIWSAGVGVSWEIDLSGRLRAGATAAEADALAVEHGARGVRLMVLTDVASSYFTMVGALRQLDTVRAISAAQDETLRLVTARHRAGLATPFDVERAQTDASRARAAIPPLETAVAVSRNRIAVLIGDQAFNAAAITPSTRAPVAPPARAGQPAALLERRPDLLAAKAAARRRQRAPATGSRGVVPAALSRRVVRPRQCRHQRLQPGRRALHQRRRAAGDADLQRRDGRRRSTRSRRPASPSPCCATKTPSCARWKMSKTPWPRSAISVNAPTRWPLPPHRPRRPLGARSHSTTVDRSTCCRCSMRSASDWSSVSAPTTATRSCCSTACSSTRRWAAAGRCSTRSRTPAQASAAPSPTL